MNGDDTIFRSIRALGITCIKVRLISRQFFIFLLFYSSHAVYYFFRSYLHVTAKLNGVIYENPFGAVFMYIVINLTELRFLHLIQLIAF